MSNRNIKKRSTIYFDSIISAVTQSVHKSLELHEVLDSAVESIKKNMDHVDNISIYMVEGDIAVLKAYRGYSDKFIEKVGTIPYPKGFTWKTIIEGKSTYVADVDTDNVIGPAGREVGTKSYYSAPLKFQSKTVGAININSLSKDAFSKNDLKLLEIVAYQIEVAITNSKKTESLKLSEQRLAARNRDIEEAYSKLEKQSMQLIQIEKMATIGTLVGGIAHELNNPFMCIINYIEYCLKHTLKDDKRYEYLELANNEVTRCVNIVKNLMTFSQSEGEGSESVQVESLTEVIDRVINLLAYNIKKTGATIILNKTMDIPDIHMRISNIQQVFFNILLNALDAVKKSPRKDISIDILNEGEVANVIITDTGKGIPVEYMSKIFEPFFTTKKSGYGTGLGLSVCKNIIYQHNGDIKCESLPGEGTKVIISLPILHGNHRRFLL